MVQLDILYPYSAGCRFDFDYYIKSHMPLVRRLLGDTCKGIRIQRGLVGLTPGSPPTFAVTCHMLFESVDAFVDAWMVHGEILGNDVANYTDVPLVMQFSEPVPYSVG